jgi:protoporphyrinogen oxidase
MRICVIGAGPAGITCAYELSKRGFEVDVYDAAPQVGGMAKTFELWNQKVDLGPHRFFSSDPRVNKLWLEVVGRDYAMVDRLTRIYYKRRFFMYPLKPANALLNLGVFEAARCVLSFVTQQVLGSRNNDQSTFEGWVVSRFGRRLFEIFFKSYSEKLWGISCLDLDADFAAQRIKKLSLYEAVKNAFLGGGKTRHKTLVDRFAYPFEGTGVVYDRMAQKVVENGGRVLLSTPVRRVMTEGMRATGIELENGEILHYDHVVSSMPLTQVVQRMDGCPPDVVEASRRLKFRNTILVYLKVESDRLFPDNWLYVHSPDLLMGRVTNFRNWVPQLYGNEKSSILSLEYWCNDDEEMWRWDDARLVELARKEIEKAGLTEGAPISAGAVRRVPKCYPVYRVGYKDELQKVVDHLRDVDSFTVIGRYGAFKYNNQDHSILMGLLAAESISGDAENDLWKINTDYEYQEKSSITETGLVSSAS